jgi:hypothetical protein
MVFVGDFVAAADNQILQTTKERGQTGTAAEGYDIQSARGLLRLGSAFFHVGLCTFYRKHSGLECRKNSDSQTQAIGDGQRASGIAMAIRFKAYNSQVRDFPYFLDERTAGKVREQRPG